MKTILLTGFEAFGETPVNPAETVARRLDGITVGDHRVVSLIVPNTFFESIDVVCNAISDTQPNAVVMLGEYGGRSLLTVERLAHNLNDSARYGLADNAGKTLNGVATMPGGPVAYYSQLPLRAMVKAMRTQGIPADISDTPGTNVCNHLMYGVLHAIHTNGWPIRAGWIHLPHLPEVAALDSHLGAPSMSADTAASGVRIALDALVANPQDIEDPIVSRWQI